MILLNKIIPALILFSVVVMTSGCVNSTAESVSSTSGDNYPARVALEAMGRSFQENATDLKVTQQVNSGEAPDKAIVTVEQSGLMDDSVAAERTVFTMNYREGQWETVSRVTTQRCWPERGHQQFSEQPCD